MSWKHATQRYVGWTHEVRDSRTGQLAPAKEQTPAEARHCVRVQQWRRRVLQRRGAQMHGLMVRDAQSCSLAMLDTAGVVVSWYGRTGESSERAADHVVDRHVSQFYVPEEVASKQPRRDLHVATVEGSTTREGWQRRPDGGIFWGTTVIKALTLRDGRLQGFSYMTSASEGPVANVPVAQSLDLPADAANEHSLPAAGARRILPTWDRMARGRSNARQRRLFRLACRLRVPERPRVSGTRESRH